jgi:dCMP deaminase
VTCTPCRLCAKLIASAGISRICYGEPYRGDPNVVSELIAAGVEFFDLGDPNVEPPILKT